MEYTPNWKNKHVQKRLKKVLNWANQFCIGKRGKFVPVRLHSKYLNEVFGPTKNPLGDYLRAKLIKEISASYSTEQQLSKQYKVHVQGYDELLQYEIYEKKEQVVQVNKKKVKKKNVGGGVGEAYVDTSLPTPIFEEFISQFLYVDTNLTPEQKDWLRLDRAKSIHAAEFAELSFNMHDSGDRRYHMLQNINRKYKQEFWKDTLPYDYDISACAPNIIYQYAVMLGMPPLLAAHVKNYIDNKNQFRKHLALSLDIDVDTAKIIINGLFNGAELRANDHYRIFNLLNQDKHKVKVLQENHDIKLLRLSIKHCWAHISKSLNTPIKNGGDRWKIYFRLERSVLDVIINKLTEQNIKYFTEHDGFRTNVPVNTQDLEQEILTATKLTLLILGN